MATTPKRFCPDCVYYGAPREVPFITPKAGLSPGGLEASRKWMELQAKRREAERDRVMNPNYEFDYEPKFWPWCKCFTATDLELQQVKAGLLEGDETPRRQLSELGKKTLIDGSSGMIYPVYAICARVNSEADCNDFEPRKGTK
ncbi:MAG: hypothetical protein H0X02_09085 [Nitrosomonas sp.]|nr:hypothetical protein [Nitrosomonas sp.]